MFEWSKINTILKKELLDLFRDSRTILITIFMPLIVFPLIVVTSTKMTFNQQEKILTAPVKLVIKGSSDRLESEFKNNSKIILTDSTDELLDLKDEKIDAVLNIPEKFDEILNMQENPTLIIQVMSSKPYSEFAFTKLTTIIEQFNREIITERFANQNLNNSLLFTTQIQKEDISTNQEKSGSFLAFLLPLFLIILSYNSGAFTAMDLIAGEKERRTLESLLMSPISQVSIILGKFFAVSVITVLTVIIATLSLFASIKLLLLPQNLGVIDLSFISVFALIGLGSVLAIMFASILIAISAFSRSLKEAQSYMGPLYLIIILPVALINMIPQQVVPDWYFTIPIINALFLFREMLLDILVVKHIIITSLVFLIVSILMLLIATRIFKKETVISRSI